MSDPNDAPPGDRRRNGGDRRRPGASRWLLLLSLALNLFILAWLGMGALHHSGVFDGRSGAGWHGHGPERMMGRSPSAWHGPGGFERPHGALRGFLFERPDDPSMAALYDRHGADLRAAFAEAWSARRTLHTMMERAEESGRVDSAALTDALAAVRAATARVQATLHRALVDAAETLPPERFEDLVEHRGLRPWRHDHNDRRGDSAD